ncbi:hypothetical protein ACNQF7_10155 [Flavobacterium sp. RSP29]|uniref:hypothetical protein n=1 Tax=Flavobacterium sp. RSP29 TaxID=3401731 RepID=UPI003AAE23E3
MEKFLEQLLGTIDLPTYAAWFVLAFIGAATAILIRSKVKYKSSEETPDKWRLGFLIQDNLINLLVGFLITFIFLRFSNETLKMEPTSFGALIIGATNNELALLFMKFSLKARK